MKAIGRPRSVIRQMSVVLVTAVCLAVVTPMAHAGGVAIVNTVLTDDGDNDGFADTNETVSMRLTVRNTSGSDLTDRPQLARPPACLRFPDHDQRRQSLRG